MNEVRDALPDVGAERWLTRAEVADLIGVSTQTLRDWERTGRGPKVIRFSKKVARYSAAQFARAS